MKELPIAGKFEDSTLSFAQIVRALGKISLHEVIVDQLSLKELIGLSDKLKDFIDDKKL